MLWFILSQPNKDETFGFLKSDVSLNIQSLYLTKLK